MITGGQNTLFVENELAMILSGLFDFPLLEEV
jgi:hypothetical protein